MEYLGITYLVSAIILLLILIYAYAIERYDDVTVLDIIRCIFMVLLPVGNTIIAAVGIYLLLDRPGVLDKVVIKGK